MNPIPPAEPSPRRRVVFEDPDLPHQIVITLLKGSHRLMVSCNCMRRAGGGVRGAYAPIEVRARWEAIGVWRAHMAEVEAA